MLPIDVRNIRIIFFERISLYCFSLSLFHFLLFIYITSRLLRKYFYADISFASFISFSEKFNLLYLQSKAAINVWYQEQRVNIFSCGLQRKKNIISKTYSMSMPYANILSSINSSSFKQERLSILQTNKCVTEYMITRYPVLRLGYRSSALNNSYSRLRDSINTYVNVRNNILYNISYLCYI